MHFKTLAAGLALSFCSQFVLAAEHTVEMKNSGAEGTMVFEPAVLKVAVGDTVKFVPTAMGHNSESIADLMPAGATAWKGGMSQEVSVTIDKEGVYVYKCLPHTVMAMVGVIVAGEATNLDDVKAKAAPLSASFVMNKTRLDDYLAQAK